MKFIKNYSVIIVEDDVEAAEMMRKLLLINYESIQVLDIAHNVQDAYESIQKNNPDIVFLDIILGEDNGFSILKLFEKLFFHLVFTSAHTEFAIQAFDFPSPHFLVKPIQIDKLHRVMNRINAATLRNETREHPIVYSNLAMKGKLAFSSAHSTELIEFNRIEFLVAEGSYTELHLTDETKRTSSKILGHYEKSLNPNLFCRVHRKYIVNINHIIKYDKSRSMELVLSSGTIIQSSSVYKKDLLFLLKRSTIF